MSIMSTLQKPPWTVYFEAVFVFNLEYLLHETRFLES